MPQVSQLPDGRIVFTVADVNKGYWSWGSPASCPEGFATTMNNIDLRGGVPTSMPGDGVDQDVAYDAASTVKLHCDYKSSAGGAPVSIVGTNNGKIFRVTGGATTELRRGLSTTDWWSHQQYGTYLFISNPTDGVYYYDNDTLIPHGAKPIAQCETDEAGLWAGETADATNFQEGIGSFYVESTGAQATMTFTPAANFDATTARESGGTAYASDKSPGTDFYHFKVMFSNTGTPDTTNTRVLLTDGSAVTLNFPMTVWDSDKDGTAFDTTPTAGTWYDCYLPAVDGTDSGTFNAANIDTFAFAVDDNAAATLRMNVDDIYVVYNVTMPAVQVLCEWKNILFGMQADIYYFTPVGISLEYNTLANAAIKSGGNAITGAGRFYNQLTIGTDFHVFSISGSPVGQTYPSYRFDSNQVTDEKGISSHRSIVKGGNALYWFWKREICRYDGTSVTKMSFPLDAYLTVDENAEQYVVGAPFYTRNQLWWTWRRSGQSVNDRVIRLDLEYNAWLPVSGLTTPTVFRTTSSSAEQLETIDESTRKIYAQNHTSNLSFVGTSISYALELPPMVATAQGCDWIMAWLQWLSNSGTMLIEFRQGDTLLGLVADAYETLETSTMTAAGEYGENRIGDRAVWCQIRFSSTATKMELQPPFVVYARPIDAAAIRVTP